MLKLLVLILIQIAFCTCAENKNILQYLENNSEYSTLVDLLRHANLTGALSSQGTLTLFAPTNDAFAKLPQAFLSNLMSLDTTALKNLLLYHVSNGILIAPLLNDGMTVDTLSNAKIHVNKYSNGAVVVEGATVTGGDIIVTNGVIHAINKVMFPAQLTISEFMVKDDSEFKDLYAALVFTGLEPALAASGNYTIFAPNDDAFVDAVGGLQALTSDKARFTEVLKYHVVPKVLFAAGLTDGQELTTLQGTTLRVHVDSTGVHINNALVLKPDQPVTNGVIHTIDSILSPA